MPRSPRTLALWCAALAVAVVTTIVVAGDLAALHRRARELGPERPVVVARHDLHTGSTVTPADVTTRRVHARLLPDGALGGTSVAVGRVVAVPVLRDTYVLGRNLTPSARTGLDGVVPSGMRAVRVSVGDGIEPPIGASVDVLASFDNVGATTGSRPSTLAVAEGALVLRTDARAGGPSGRGGGVTVLVTAAEAERVADAQARGVVALALVPPEDARGGEDPR